MLVFYFFDDASLISNVITWSLSQLIRLLNPWNHRADILAQAYLIPSKMAKINITELFLPNTL